jgi:ectoine hydroxylase-related dioxygenase (phytanoyl-CoA dioxygenase family)
VEATFMSQVKTHAVREFHRNDTDDDFRVEEIRNLGYTIIDGGFGADELRSMREKIDGVYERQVREIGGGERLSAMNDADVARCLVAYDDYFLRLAAHPRVISITSKLLGVNFLLMSQNGIINRSTDEHYQVTWHRDLNYQHFVSSRPLAVSALVAVDEFSPETGGTCLIPASHKAEVFPSPEYVARHQIQVSAPAGSVLIFDSMVYHRSGHNSSGHTRRAVNHIYALPLIKQQFSLPKIFGGRYADDPLLRRLIGYDSETAEGVQQWREQKLRLAGLL